MYQNGAMGGDGGGVAGNIGGIRRAAGDQYDVGEAGVSYPSNGIGAGAEEAEEIHLGLEFVDLLLELLLRLPCLHVALAARAGVAIAVVLLARLALHPQPPPRSRRGRRVDVVIVLLLVVLVAEIHVGIGGEPPPALVVPPHSVCVSVCGFFFFN